MKHELEIAKELKQLEADFSPIFISKKEKEVASKRAAFLRGALQIIAIHPNEALLKKQLESAKAKLAAYKKACREVSGWCYTREQIKSYRNTIESSYEPTKAVNQVEIIEFVLN